MIVGQAGPVAQDPAQQRQEVEDEGQRLDEFLARLFRVDLEDEAQLEQVKEFIQEERSKWLGTRIEADVSAQLSRINQALRAKIKGRELREKLLQMEAVFADHPTLAQLGELFAAANDPELAMCAQDGADLKAWYDTWSASVTRRYLESMRTAADAAVASTNGAGLGPFGLLEDALDLEVSSAGFAGDQAMLDRYVGMRQKLRAEVDGIAVRLFDRKYQERQPWQDLLADPAAWLAIKSSSFTFEFAGSMLLKNEATDGAGSGGLCYEPASGWRDYVLDFEVRLDSGQLVFYARVGDKMDSKYVPSLWMNPNDPQGRLQYGRVHSVTMAVIGSSMTIALDGTQLDRRELPERMSRKGLPGIEAKVGTQAQVTRLRVRQLR